MKLILSQCPDPRVPPLDPPSKIVNRTSLKIGRGADNGWVLPDPDRDLSKLHCTVNYSNGMYSVTDLSTNGVYLNGSADRVHRGSTVVIEDGDIIKLGAYSVSVRMAPLDAQYSPPPAAARPGPPPAPDFFAAVPVGNIPNPFGGIDPFGTPGSSGAAAPLPPSGDKFGREAAEMLDDFDLDDFIRPQPPGAPPFGSSPSGPPSFGAPPAPPFGAASSGAQPFGAPQFGAAGFGQQSGSGFGVGDDLDIFGDKPATPNWSGPAQPDHVPSTSEYFTPPKVASQAIPDDWDIMGEPTIAPAPPPMSRPPMSRPSISPPPMSMPDPVPEFDPFADARISPPPTPPVPFPQPGPQPQMAAPLLEAMPFEAMPLAPPPVAAPRMPAPQMQAPPMAAPQPASPAGSGAAAELLAQFLAGAGLNANAIGDADPAATMNVIGQTYRQMVEGLREILMARSLVKSEFRMNQTVIAARNNNPLKFSFDVDAALIALLKPPSAGYQPAQQAVAEGFKDIQAHNIAIMAGMQVALRLLLNKFKPEDLAQNLEKSSMLSNILPSGRKARYWEAFVAAYSKIAREAEDDFLGVFGREFARAYEEQVGKL